MFRFVSHGLLAATCASGILAASGAALAADGSRNGLVQRGGDRGDDRGRDNGRRNNDRHDNDHRYNDRRGDGDRTRVNINLGFGSSYRGYDRCNDFSSRSYTSIGWSGSYYNNYNSCRDRVVVVDRPCPPPVVFQPYCPPPVVIQPYCPPPVVVAPCPPRTVYIDRPVTETVYIERPAPTVVYRDPAPNVVVQPVVVQPAVYVESANLRDRADQQLRAGRLTLATDLYRNHLQQVPTDDVARRSLAFALIADFKYEEAAAQITAAYQSNPSLARQPQSLAGLFDGGSQLGRAFNEVRAIAERSNSAQSYLLATVIAQSIGNADSAATMLDRARSAGLPEHVARELTLAVTSR